MKDLDEESLLLPIERMPIERGDDPVKRTAVTFWLPDDLKIKFDQLQERSKKKFGKEIIKLISRAIEMKSSEE